MIRKLSSGLLAEKNLPFLPQPCRNLTARDLNQLLAIIGVLHAQQSDLDLLPLLITVPLKALTNADYITYSETDLCTQEHRPYFSYSPPRLAELMSNYLAHMNSHPFWALEPGIFKNHILQSADFFSNRQLRELSIFHESLFPAGCSQLMRGSFRAGSVLIRLGVRREGHRPFNEQERERMSVFLSHFQHIYQAARQRTLARLSPRRRLSQAFPDLTRRQLDVACWLAEGKSNEIIARLLNISLDGVKFHLRSIYRIMGVEDRFNAALTACQLHPEKVFSEVTILLSADPKITESRLKERFGSS